MPGRAESSNITASRPALAGVLAVAGWLAAMTPASLAQEDSAPGAVPERVALTLDDCIAIALANQPAIGVQQSSYGVAVETQKVARSYYFPQLDFQMRYTHLDDPVTVDFPSPVTGEIADVFSDAAAFFGIARQAGSAAANAALDNASFPPFLTAKQMALDRLPETFQVGVLGRNSLTTELLLTQPIWTGGKITYRHQQAGLGVQAACHDIRRSRHETIFHVTQAYLNVQLAGALHQIAEDAVGQFQAIESFVRALVEQGDEYVTTVDLSRIRTVRQLTEADVIRVEQVTSLARAALNQAMGMDPNTELEIAEETLSVEPRTIELPIVLDRAMRNRPELAKARIGVEIADLERKLAHAEFLPDLAAFSRFSTIDADGGFPNPNDAQRHQWAVGVTLGVPVYAGGRRSAEVRAAEFAQAKARQTWQLTEQLITLELKQAYLEYLESLRSIPIAEAAVEEAESTLRGYQDQFRGGLIKDENMPEYFEDLVQSRLLLSEARTRYNRTVQQYHLAIAKIQLVSGSDEPDSTSAVSGSSAVHESRRGSAERPGYVRLPAARGGAAGPADGRHTPSRSVLEHQRRLQE